MQHACVFVSGGCCNCIYVESSHFVMCPLTSKYWWKPPISDDCIKILYDSKMKKDMVYFMPRAEDWPLVFVSMMFSWKENELGSDFYILRTPVVCISITLKYVLYLMCLIFFFFFFFKESKRNIWQVVISGTQKIKKKICIHIFPPQGCDSQIIKIKKVLVSPFFFFYIFLYI